MKKLIVTGASGTVGRVLVEHLNKAGYLVTPISHRQFRMGDWQAMNRLLAKVRPDAVFHLALASQPTGLADEGRLVNEEWPAALAKWCGENGVRLVFTSTVMVYGEHQQGPFRPETPPEPTTDYGRQKLAVERRLTENLADLVIVRLGWQIGSDFKGNQMLAYLKNELRQKGELACSPAFLPSCSFLTQTAQALSELLKMPPGLYLLNANRRLSFYQIADALQKRFDLPGKILAEEVFRQDQRMLDERVPMRDVEEVLREECGKI